MPNPVLTLSGAALFWPGTVVFEDLDLAIPAGRVTALCGPNGCGKSTALKAMRRLLPLGAGEARLCGRPLSDWPSKALARELALLTQSPDAPGEMRVRDLVALGRYAHRPRLAGLREADRAAVAEAMAAVDVADLADRPVGALSGGQLQRAWLAMVVAQESPVLLLDEPTNHLDIAHALEVLALVRRLVRAKGRTVAVVLHDLNLAARYADHLVLFEACRIAAEGPVDEVFRADILGKVFGITCEIAHVAGQRVMVPTL